MWKGLGMKVSLITCIESWRLNVNIPIGQVISIACSNAYFWEDSQQAGGLTLKNAGAKIS